MDAMDPGPPPEPLKASARRTAATLIRTLQNRAELFGLEIEEEGRWVVAALVWTIASIFFTLLAITIGTLTVAMFFPEKWLPWVLLAFSAIFVFLAISAVAGLKKHFKTHRPPMSDTVNELRKDLEWIQPRE